MNIIAKLTPTLRRGLVTPTLKSAIHRPIIRKTSTQTQITQTKNASKSELLLMATQTGILMGGGDLIAQMFIEKTPTNQLNWLRTAQFFGIGFLIAGPGLRVWYGVIDSKITTKSRSLKTLQKVIVDQLLFAPMFIAGLISLLGALQNHSADDLMKKLKNEYPDILKANYCVWPWVQLVNFYLLPLKYQVLFVQIVAIFWNTFVSWRTNKDHLAEVAQVELNSTK